MKQILKGVAATLGLVSIVAGMPTLLVLVADIGAPHLRWSFEGVIQALLSPDDGTLLLQAFKVVGWVTWAVLTVAIGLELSAAIRCHPTPRVPGFALPQKLARNLVATAALLFVAAGSVGATASGAAAAPSHGTSSIVSKTGGHAATGVAATDTKAGHSKIHDRVVTVKKGDTLSEIALKETGRASNYPKLYRASRHTSQPGGRHLTDPDLILAGWKITIPGASATEHKAAPATEHKAAPATEHKAAPATEHKAAPATEHKVIIPGIPPQGVPTSAAPSHAPSPSASEVPAASEPVVEPGAVTTDAPESDVVPVWLLCGLAGAGSLLAGGLWVSLRRRRASQFRSRRPGRAVAAPPPQLAPVEKTLMHAGGPTGDLVLFVDEVLRRVAGRCVAAGESVPPLVGIDVAETSITIRLAATTQMPKPWASLDPEDHQVWRIARDVDLDAIGPLEPDSPPPWPQLVTLGWDEAGWRVVNLESLGVVSVTGDAVYGEDLARYLVSELAVLPWSRDVEIDCLEICGELPGLAPGRLRHHDTAEVVGRTLANAVETFDRLREEGSESVESARAAQAGDELWDSRVLVSSSADAEHIDVLADLISTRHGRTATSLLLVDNSSEVVGVEFHLTSAGRIIAPALGLDLVVNGLTEAEAMGCVAVLAAGESLGDVEVPDIAEPDQGWQEMARVDGSLREDLTIPRAGVEATAGDSVLAEPDDVYSATANTPEDLAELGRRVPAEVRQRVESADPRLDTDVEQWFAADCARPRLQVLGPIRVRAGSGGEPSRVASRTAFYSELVAYLASKRATGATTEDVADAFSISPARVRKDISVARQWLGTNSGTGEPWLPSSRKHAMAEERGIGLYVVPELLVDADLFLRLRLRGQARGREGLADLRTALTLVGGVPYDGLRARGGIWLTDSRDDQNLLCAVVDVAHIVSTAALGAGDLEQARAAAELAVLAAPSEATPHLDLAAVAAVEGDRGTAAAIARQVAGWRDGAGEPIDLPVRASAILASQRWMDDGSGQAAAG